MKRFLLLLSAWGSWALASDPLDPATQRLLVENAWVRVFKATYAPGQSSAWHAHPERVVVLLTDWKARMETEGREPGFLKGKKGQVLHTPPLRHRVTNLSAQPAEAIEVELKPDAPPVEGPYPDGPEAAPRNITAEFENDRIRVLRIRVGAEEALPMHGHAPRVVVELTGSSFMTSTKTGALTGRDFEPGTTVWVDRITWHREVNTSPAPYERITVEFKSGAPPIQRVRAGGRIFGLTDQGKGEPLVLIHDAFGDLTTFDGAARKLKEGFRVIAYSRRGHFPNAHLGAEESYAMGVQAEDLKALLEAKQVGPAVLVGHGHGAAVALLTALRHPTRVKRLVLVDPELRGLLPEEGPPPTALAPFQARLEVARRDQRFGAGVEAWAEQTFRPLTIADLPKTFRDRLQANAETFQAFLSPPGPRLRAEDLRALRVPVQVLCGSGSPPEYAEGAKALARWMPRIQVQVVDGAGRGFPWQEAERFAEVLKAPGAR